MQLRRTLKTSIREEGGLVGGCCCVVAASLWLPVGSTGVRTRLGGIRASRKFLNCDITSLEAQKQASASCLPLCIVANTSCYEPTHGSTPATVSHLLPGACSSIHRGLSPPHKKPYKKSQFKCLLIGLSNPNSDSSNIPIYSASNGQLGGVSST
jgi:hypothetical protein